MSEYCVSLTLSYPYDCFVYIHGVANLTCVKYAIFVTTDTLTCDSSRLVHYVYVVNPGALNDRHGYHCIDT